MKKTTVWLHVGGYDVTPWKAALERLMPDISITHGVDDVPWADIDIAIAWKPPEGTLQAMTRLKAILALSAGAEALLSDATVPDVPIARFVHPSTQRYYRDYVLHAVLDHYRQMQTFRAAQAGKVWKHIAARPHHSCRIGLVGLGELGATAGRCLVDLGFPVSAWSRSKKDVAGITSHCGQEGLMHVVGSSDILVAVLPATAETENIINRALLMRMPKGGYLINIGRGGHLVEDDLLSVIREGHLSGATLDVMRTEPPDVSHPFWTTPEIRLTPHVASTPDPSESAQSLCDNIRRVMAGGLPMPLVDQTRGY